MRKRSWWCKVKLKTTLQFVSCSLLFSCNKKKESTFGLRMRDPFECEGRLKSTQHANGIKFYNSKQGCIKRVNKGTQQKYIYIHTHIMRQTEQAKRKNNEIRQNKKKESREKMGNCCVVRLWNCGESKKGRQGLNLYYMGIIKGVKRNIPFLKVFVDIVVRRSFSSKLSISSHLCVTCFPFSRLCFSRCFD